jgi:catechol 2,3-dioxygenase-like lactoylglutathione lyase family enzyme
MMASVNHVGLTVTDLDASIVFYRDIAGMELVRRYPVADDEWFQTLTENADAVVEAVMMQLGEFRIQLVRYHKGGGPGAHGHAVEGGMHLCIDVDDVDATLARITALGQYHVGPMVERHPYGGRSFYVHDPDGVPVEFVGR